MIHKYVIICPIYCWVGWGLGKKSQLGDGSRKIVSYLASNTAFKTLAAVDAYLEACKGKSFGNLRHTAVPRQCPALEICIDLLKVSINSISMFTPFLSHLQVKAKPADPLGIRRVQALVRSSDRPRSFDPATVLEALGGCRSSTRYFSQFPGE